MTTNAPLTSTPDTVRIGYVLKRYPRFSETFVVNEILAHERAGLEIEIFALGPVEESHFQDLIGHVQAPVHRLPYRLRSPDLPWQWMREAAQALPAFWSKLARFGGISHDDEAQVIDADDLVQAVRLALEVKARGLNHLHAHFATSATTVAQAAAAFADISFSFTAHAKDIYFDYATPQFLDRKLRDAAFAVTVSDYNARHLRGQFPMLSDRLLRLYNGVDLERFSAGAPGPADGGQPPTILAVGRLVDKKGFHILVEAAALLRDRGLPFRCELIGDGPDRAMLEQLISERALGEHLQLFGARPQQAVMAAMREATVLAMPCVVSADGNRDGLPTVLIEAMALGTPVVSTAVTGIPELVSDGLTGLCVAPDDPVALADALERLLRDRSLRERLARAAREAIVRDFDIDRNARLLREQFTSAIAGQRARAVQDGGRS